MNNIITPRQVADLAFAAGEYLDPEAILEADIAAAQHRYIEPVTGRALAEALAQGRYDDFRDRYAAPALAMWVRVMVQPVMDIRTGPAGSVVQRTASAAPAGDNARAASIAALRQRARQLLRRMSGELERLAAQMPEYDPDSNILAKRRIEGGIVL